MVGVAVSLTFSTVESWYPGTGSSTRGPTEQTVAVTVRFCERVGPVSHHGFGYWWECTIVAPGHGSTVVDRSILGPPDVGLDVELQQACFREDYCVYGKRVHWLVTTAFLALRIIDRLASVLFVSCALVWLARGVLGPERYWRLVASRIYPDRGQPG